MKPSPGETCDPARLIATPVRGTNGLREPDGSGRSGPLRSRPELAVPAFLESLRLRPAAVGPLPPARPRLAHQPELLGGVDVRDRRSDGTRRDDIRSEQRDHERRRSTDEGEAVRPSEPRPRPRPESSP